MPQRGQLVFPYGPVYCPLRAVWLCSAIVEKQHNLGWMFGTTLLGVAGKQTGVDRVPSNSIAGMAYEHSSLQKLIGGMQQGTGAILQ